DERVFARLVEAYTPGMRRLALTYVRTPSLADDVVQEAWLGVLKGLAGFQGRSSLRTWIYRIVANIARTRAVREARTTPFSSFEHEEGPSVDPERFERGGHWSAPPEPWRRVLDAEARALGHQRTAGLPGAQPQGITLRARQRGG